MFIMMIIVIIAMMKIRKKHDRTTKSYTKDKHSDKMYNPINDEKYNPTHNKQYNFAI
jgi:hypothetical protein